MNDTSHEKCIAVGTAPKDLAGFQLLCSSLIKPGDLFVGRGEIEWADDSLFGKPTTENGALGLGGAYRIYRRSKPPSHEGRTELGGTTHYSNPEPKPTEVGPDHGLPVITLPSGATLPVNAAKRKGIPIATGVIDYFPDALAEVAKCSMAGNRQHHAGKPLLHWDKSKSTDEADALMRHFLDRGTLDADGLRHSAKVAWRALALLQREIDATKAGAK